MSIRILTIDDSHTLRLFISRSLQKQSKDFEISTAENGHTGLSMAREALPDLILLDYVLPDFNGDQVCQKLLDGASTKDIPVVFLSSNINEARQAATKYTNIKRTLAKPFTPELLYATINFVLRRTSSRDLQNGHSDFTKKESQRSPRSITKPVSRKGAKTKRIASHLSNHFEAQDNESAPKNETSTKKSKAPQTKPLALKTAMTPTLIFRGRTSHFLLSQALRAIHDQRLTGVLRTFLQKDAQELYVSKGQVLFNTTRNVPYYLQGANLNFPDDQKEILNLATHQQSQLGQPFFLSLFKDNILTQEKANNLTLQFGSYLFSRNWLATDIMFEFQALLQFPDFVTNSNLSSLTMQEWTMESLRSISTRDLSQLPILLDERGIPGYTPLGFDIIYKYPLNEDDVKFAQLVDKSQKTVGEIAQQLELSIDQAKLILFRYISLEIFQYWPIATTKP
ncbi:MAG: response regulator [Verrucomicrobiota bacterium]